MNVRVLLVALSVQFAVSFGHPSHNCPNFAASFTVSIDQLLDNPMVAVDDLDLTFFREILGFTDYEIQATLEKSIVFFNETYGLDFSLTTPNDQNEYFLGNARLSPFYPEDIDFVVQFTNWLRNGNSRRSCRDVHVGGFRVSFTGERLLHGSYGGVEGRPVTVGNTMDYAFIKIQSRPQRPVIIQYRTPTPFRIEPVDMAGFLNFELYNRYLGSGRAQGSVTVRPDQDNPGKFRLTARNAFTFLGH